MKIRMRPIHVFCFHHVSAEYDSDMMWESDWMQIDKFQENILAMRRTGVKFISLRDASNHIRNDWFRYEKYAVVTFDDGWASLKNIVPWLIEQHIPVTLFLNPAYMQGVGKREKGISLTSAELKELLREGNEYIQIASHGWTHSLCTDLTVPQFDESVDKCVKYLSVYNEYIPFFAYPCGKHSSIHDNLLLKRGITPVYCDGMKNYNNASVIHREC